MTLTTFLCFVFIITQAVPINASFSCLDPSYYQTVQFFINHGYRFENYGLSHDNSSFTFSWSYHEPIDTPGGTLAGTGTADGHITNPSERHQFVFPALVTGGSVSSIASGAWFSTGSRYTDLNAQAGGSYRVVPGYDDFFVLSYVSTSSLMPYVSSGFNCVDLYSQVNGSYILHTVGVYPVSSTGLSFLSFDLNFSKYASPVVPIYAGNLSGMSDDLRAFAGLTVYTQALGDVVTNGNINSLLPSINVSIDSIEENVISMNSSLNQLVQYFVSGNSSSSSASDSLDTTVGSADSAISSQDNLESGMISDFHNHMVAPDTSFVNQLSSTSNWVKTQFDRLVNINPVFSSVVVLSLTIALALVIVGKLRG